MKFYLLDDPQIPAKYAMFSHLGTWSSNYKHCKFCGLHSQKLIEPLLVEWEPGTDVIGDFSWCGYTMIVRDQVKQFFDDQELNCLYGKIKYVPPTGKKRPKRVPFPYTGPRLYWAICQNRILLNEKLSGVDLEIDCKVCGQKKYTFRQKGIVINKVNWKGEKMFLIDQFGKSKATFVIETFLKELISQKFTNFSYIESGVIE